MFTHGRYWLGVVLIIGVFSILGFGIVPSWPHYFQTPEQRYEYLIQSIWCPIWRGETVAASNAGISGSLRDTIREMVENGRTNQEVYDHMHNLLPRLRGYMHEIADKRRPKKQVLKDIKRELGESTRRTVKRFFEQRPSGQGINQFIDRQYRDKVMAIPYQGPMYRMSYGLPYFIVGIMIALVYSIAWWWSLDSSDDSPDEFDEDDAQRIDQLSQDLENPLN